MDFSIKGKPVTAQPPLPSTTTQGSGTTAPPRRMSEGPSGGTVIVSRKRQSVTVTPPTNQHQQDTTTSNNTSSLRHHPLVKTSAVPTSTFFSGLVGTSKQPPMGGGRVSPLPGGGPRSPSPNTNTGKPDLLAFTTTSPSEMALRDDDELNRTAPVASNPRPIFDRRRSTTSSGNPTLNVTTVGGGLGGSRSGSVLGGRVQPHPPTSTTQQRSSVTLTTTTFGAANLPNRSTNASPNLQPLMSPFVQTPIASPAFQSLGAPPPMSLGLNGGLSVSGTSLRSAQSGNGAHQAGQPFYSHVNYESPSFGGGGGFAVKGSGMEMRNWGHHRRASVLDAPPSPMFESLASPNVPSNSHRRKSIQIREGSRFNRPDAPMYSDVRIAPLTYGEGAQTFYGSTQISRSRSRAHSGHVIYSTAQLVMQRLAHKPLDFPWYGERATTSSMVGESPSDLAADFQPPLTDSPISSAVSPIRGGSNGGAKTIAPRFGNNDTIRNAVKRAAGLSSQDQQQLLAASGASFSASASANVTSLSMSKSLASALFSGPNAGGISSKTQGSYDATIADAMANRQSTSTAMLQRLLTAIASDPLTQRSIAMADGSHVPQSRNPTMSPSRPNFNPHDDNDDADDMDVVISTNEGPDTDDLLNCTSSYDDALKSTAVFRVDEIDDEEQLTANAAFAAAYGPDKKNRVSSAGSSNPSSDEVTNLTNFETIDKLFERFSQREESTATSGSRKKTLAVPPGAQGSGNTTSTKSVVRPVGSGSQIRGQNNNGNNAATNNGGEQQRAIDVLFGDNKQVQDVFKGAMEASESAQAAKLAVIPAMFRKGVIRDDAGPNSYQYTKKAKERRRRVAVVVGIGQYEDRRIQGKGQCEVDAEDLAEILRKIGFIVTLLTTKAKNPDGTPHSEYYPTRSNILNSIAQATRTCRTLECLGMVVVFGGGYIGPIAQPSTSNQTQEARRVSLATSHVAKGVGNTLHGVTSGAVLVPPETSLSNITGDTTLTLSDLEVSGAEKGPKNVVYVDTHSVLNLKPCDHKLGGFCFAGGRKSVGGDISAFYADRQSLIMSFYLRRGFIGYATRDSRISTNSLNAYLTRKLRKYGAKVESSSSSFFIGDLDVARVHELRYTRHDIRDIKAEQFSHFAKFHMVVIPTRNQDPLAVEFVREIQRKFQGAVSRSAGSAMVCYSRLIRHRYHFFMRSAIAEKLFLQDSSLVAHEGRVLAQFTSQLRDNTLQYQLNCHHNILAGALTIRNRVTSTEFVNMFDNRANIKEIRRLKKLVEEEKRQKLQVGRVHRGLNAAGTISAASQLHSMPNGAGYLADTFARRFSVDTMPVHDVGIETLLTFVTSEYLAQKMDKVVRVGVFGADMVTRSLAIEPLDSKGVYVEKVVSKAQAIIRGHLTRKHMSEILPLVRREAAIRSAIIEQQTTQLLILQRDTFAAHAGAVEEVEVKQRDLWIECFTEDRELFFAEYCGSYTRAARKGKLRLLQHAGQQDHIIRKEFHWRCGFTAFAYSLMTAIQAMITVQAHQDRRYNTMRHEEDDAWRLLATKWRAMTW